MEFRLVGLRGPKSKAALQRAKETGDPGKPKAWHKAGLSRAGRVIAFIETLRITSGKGAGELFKLRPWQKKIIRRLYRTNRKGARLVREAILTMGRKNGKTELVAALCLCHLCGPEAEPYGECYSAASDRNQAGRVFRELERFITHDHDFLEQMNIKRFEKTIEVESGEGEGSIYQALSSDATKAHGLNPSFIACDEVAQWKNRELFDNLRTGAGARDEPMMITLSTKSQDPRSVMAELVDYGRRVIEGELEDDAFCAIIYETPVPVDPEKYAAQMTDEKCWKLANPALGDFRSLQDLRKEAGQARRIPAREASFRALYLNQEIDAETSFIPISEWRGCQGAIDLAALRGMPCWGGLDLSSTTDITALALYFPHCGALLCWAWVPKDNIVKREEIDRVPYRLWGENGILRTTAGRAVDRRAIALQLAEISALYDLRGLAYDQWRFEDLMSVLTQEGIELPVVRFSQSFAEMAPAADAFETAVLDRTLVHDGNPLLLWAISNVVVTMDSAGNRKPDKDRSRERIDPAVASIMAVGLHAKTKPEDDSSTPFKGRTDGLISSTVQPRQRKGAQDHAAA